MTLAEIWPTLKSLFHEDKRSLLEALSEEMVREEEKKLFDTNQPYAIWSPFDAHEAAATLQRLLDESRPST